MSSQVPLEDSPDPSTPVNKPLIWLKIGLSPLRWTRFKSPVSVHSVRLWSFFSLQLVIFVDCSQAAAPTSKASSLH